jgi:hypothetical protein
MDIIGFYIFIYTNWEIYRILTSDKLKNLITEREKVKKIQMNWSIVLYWLMIEKIFNFSVIIHVFFIFFIS